MVMVSIFLGLVPLLDCGLRAQLHAIDPPLSVVSKSRSTRDGLLQVPIEPLAVFLQHVGYTRCMTTMRVCIVRAGRRQIARQGLYTTGFSAVGAS